MRWHSGSAILTRTRPNKQLLDTLCPLLVTWPVTLAEIRACKQSPISPTRVPVSRLTSRSLVPLVGWEEEQSCSSVATNWYR